MTVSETFVHTVVARLHCVCITKFENDRTQQLMNAYRTLVSFSLCSTCKLHRSQASKVGMFMLNVCLLVAVEA